MRRTIVVVVGLALLGGACKGGKPAAGAGAPCEAVGARFLAVAKERLGNADKEGREHVEGLLAPMRDAMVKACKEAGWSPAVRDCLVAAADERGLQACQDQLTPEQRAQLDHASSDALQTP